MSEYVQGYQQAIKDVAHLLRHITTLEKVLGAIDLMPEKNPLWDAAGLIEKTLGNK